MPRIEKWNPAGIIEATLDITEKRMGKAVAVVQRQIKTSLNIGNPGGKNPSAPGEPPRKVTARLFNSIFTKVIRNGSQIIGVVGTNVVYGRRLELGFAGRDSLGRQYNQAPRPFIRPGFFNTRDKVKQILGAK